MFRRSVFSLALVAAVSMGLYGCAEEVEGPSPQIPSGDTLEPAVEPGFTCNEQIEGWFTVSGEKFSPLVVGALDDPSVDFPTVTLIQSTTIEGDPVQTEEPASVTLEATDNPDETRVKWIDSNTLAFFVDPDLALAPGGYDVQVSNPNGNTSTAEAAFGVLPRPSVGAVVPDMACVAQGERSVEVQGDHFLIGGNETPTVDIGEHTYTVDQARDCRDLVTSAFGEFQVCKSLTVTVAQGDFDPGAQQVTVNNIEPANCSSKPADDSAGFLVVAPPTVSDVTAEPVCSEQLDYDQMTVTGENFITATDSDGNQAMPTVTVGGHQYTATAADGCEAIEGLANETAQRCTSLTFTIVAGDLQDALADGERSAEVDVSVENPQPAGCNSSENIDLTVTPPPTVDDAQPEPVCVAEEGKSVTVAGFGFLTIDGALPRVKIGPNAYDADGATDCTDVTTQDDDPTAEAVQSCDTLTVTLPVGAVDPDQNHPVTVINPANAACESTEDVQYYVAGPPTFTEISPQPICTADSDNTMVVTGENFLAITDANGEAYWPTVTIGGNVYDAANIGNCTDAPLQDDGMQRPTRICTTMEVVIPRDDLAAGDHAVSVTNPLEADCTSNQGNLNIVPPPTVNSITEEIACVAQGQRSFRVDGSDFLVIDGSQPSVQIGSQTYAASVDTSSCSTATVNGRSVDTCTSLSFDVPQGDLSAGVVQVAVVNPERAACVSTNTVDLTIAAPPTVASVQPNPICSATGGSVEVTGSDFLVVDGANPTVNVDGSDYAATVDTTNDCAAVASVSSRTVLTCTRLTIDLPATTITDGPHVVTVDNPDPAGCSSTDTASLVALAEPTVSGVVEPIACNETAATSLTVSGTGFAKTAAGDLPTVTIGGNAVQTTSANNCTAVGANTGIETCTELEVLATASTLAAGSQDIVVENPGAGGCTSSGSTSVEVFSAAQVDTVNPSLYCDAAGGTDLTIDGSNFYMVDTNTPSVTIGGQTYSATVDTASCTTVNSRVERCTSLTVTVPEAELSPGTYDADVTNPAPLDCPSSQTAPVVEAGAPTIATIQPDTVCDNDTAFEQGGSVTIMGSNFLKITDSAGQTSVPSVMVNGAAAPSVTATNCTSVPNPTYTVLTCTELAVTVPSGQRDVDMHFELTNPAPADCGQPSTFDLPVEPAPVVTSVTPLRICRDGGNIQIDGQNFDQNMTVTVGGVTASGVTVNSSGTSADVNFASGLPPGDQTLTVTNPSTCRSNFDQPVTVVTGPQVFYVDPPVAYNGINTQVIIYMSGLEGGSVQEVAITDTAGTRTVLQTNFDPTRPNTVQATIPADILAQGLTDDTFDVEVIDDVNCSGSANDLLTVTDESTVAVDSITPPFGWTDSSTAVTITATDPAPSGQVQFASTPRVYLNPTNAGATTLATELRSVQFIDAAELNAIVPSGLPVGQYDVIVVNPDGTVGLLSDPNDPALGAFEVTQDPPPVIDAVSPGSWPNDQSALSVRVTGDNGDSTVDNFRQPTVEVYCELSGTTKSPTINSTTVVDGTTLDVSLDTTNLDGNSVCYMVVTNTDNGTYAEYSPITITNPSQNFISFRTGADMVVNRRDAAMTSSAPSRTTKFIYAIGGDDGTDAGAFKSMEMAQLDRLGDPSGWRVLPKPYNLNVPQNELPSALTHTEAVRIEDFVYMGGGWDAGTGAPSDKVLRANVLDPLNVPDITNVELGLGELLRGHDPGVYYYRVSAVLDPNAPDNPGGETLASEPQPVSIPPVRNLKVDLTWEEFPNAVKYRVYRTATPNQAVGTEELLAEIDAPTAGGPVTYVDDGNDTIVTGAKPLPLGSLGVWHQPTDAGGNPVALTQARFHHGMAYAPDPDDPDQYFVYGVGGTDAVTVFGDYEYFAVTVNGPRDQDVSATTQDTTNTLAEPRMKMPAVAATPTNVNGLTDSYIYALGGQTSLTNPGATTRRNDAAQVNPDGSLGAWMVLADNQRDRYGYAAGISNGTLMVAGGGGNSAATTADSNLICDGVVCQPPSFDGNWNSLSQVNLRLRRYPGYVAFNGFIYLAGGINFNTNTVLNTVDYSIVGGAN